MTTKEGITNLLTAVGRSLAGQLTIGDDRSRATFVVSLPSSFKSLGVCLHPHGHLFDLLQLGVDDRLRHRLGFFVLAVLQLRL
jgi:hypothetical protein